MTILTRSLVSLILPMVGCTAIAMGQTVPIDFAHQVAPILSKHCVECHAGDQKSGGFSLNTRESLLEGSEHGPVVRLGNASASRLIEVVLSQGEDRMPPDGPRLSDEQIEVLRKWIAQDLMWDAGFQFKKPAYEPPLKPRRPQLPPAREGRVNPIDRILDAQLDEDKRPLPGSVDDAVFARRASMDLVGLLPSPERVHQLMADKSPDKRARYIDELLADELSYAEHWLTFWNDLLRNDYGGTGFITGGRKQVSKWLYDCLIHNKPYDQMARELIAPPTDESRGYIDGIRWRGEVSAGQTVEIQFAQSISQSFLGINMKCASCHDSFIDRWKLEEAYGLAAIYANEPLEIHRCDKPMGRKATAAWLFPELGQIDPGLPQPERLKQLASLMTHADNGRFARTMVNRLWHRMMGRGIVHPLDAMQTAPWNEDLLDFLAVDFADHGFDIHRTLRLIATSQAYQSPCEISKTSTEDSRYQYAGIRAKRMTAEQFLDAVWQITGAAPKQFDAPVTRGKAIPLDAKEYALTGKWIWGESAKPGPPPAGETLRFHRQLDLAGPIESVSGIITCDNEYILFVNGGQVAKDEQWQTMEPLKLTRFFHQGMNEIDVVGKNAGSGPNLAGLYLELFVKETDGKRIQVVSDEQWQYTTQSKVDNGRLEEIAKDTLRSVVVVPTLDAWQAVVNQTAMDTLSRSVSDKEWMTRAGLLKSDFLMRSLGRPNRDQIVSMRHQELSTLEAIDLANGETLSAWLAQGAKSWHDQGKTNTVTTAEWLYQFALSRRPSPEETKSILESLGDTLSIVEMEDLIWTIIAQPEFQLVR